MHLSRRISAKTKNNAQSTARITVVAALFFFLAVIFIGKLFYLQVIKHGAYDKAAGLQRGELKNIVPARGLIYALDKDQNKFTIAGNKDTYLLFAVPAEITNATPTAVAVADALKLSNEEKWKIFLQLKKNKDPYEPLRHYLSSEEKEKITSLKIKGLYFSPETKRYYPENDVFAHLTGFVGFVGSDLVGRYGVEEQQEKELKGAMGKVNLETDPGGRLIGVGNFDITPSINGADVYLTIDRQVQFKACEILADNVKKFKAEGGAVIIQDVESGAIITLCDNPSFNPNEYNKVENASVFFNQSVNSVYEPGSIFKAITMAAALDAGVVTPDTTYEDKGILIFGKETIKNAADKIYGTANMVKVLEYSINTGAVFAAQKTGRENFKKYLQNFGFGSKTGIDLPEEAKGNISSLDRKSEIYLANASFGQGISVTPIQITNAFSAIANGGLLMRPFVVKKIDDNGRVEDTKNVPLRRVMEEHTANVLKAMLVSVIENGHGKTAAVKGYFVGGKTGTAEIPSPIGGYLNAYNHSFIGFAPATKTRFVVFVKLTNPQARFAESTAAPAFAEIMGFLLNYYQVPTER